MSTVKCGGVHDVRGRSNRHRLFLENAENKRYKDERGCESQFSEELQTLRFGPSAL